jgi:pimeloyl-ACP methyl ester carboxylesterase
VNTTSAGTWNDSRAADAANTTIVLIHGAWADGTGWQEVIPLLQKESYKVVAVQNPLTSLTADVETTKRLIDRETASGRNVVAVAHSYGGAVMSGAAAGNPGVKALVYVAALGPDEAERLDTFLAKYPTPVPTAYEPDTAGFVYLSADKYRPIFAGDLPERQTRVMWASQKPIFAAIFGESNTAAAWRTIPSWFIVAQEDQVISPDLERFYAKRMNAHTTEIEASHLVFISHPEEVAKIILEAAATVGTAGTTAQ